MKGDLEDLVMNVLFVEVGGIEKGIDGECVDEGGGWV